MSVASAGCLTSTLTLWLQANSIDANGTKRTRWRGLTMSALEGIVLQKSKVAAALVFGENLKREDIGDSCSLSRATEVAYEFSARR